MSDFFIINIILSYLSGLGVNLNMNAFRPRKIMVNDVIIFMVAYLFTFSNVFIFYIIFFYYLEIV